MGKEYASCMDRKDWLVLAIDAAGNGGLTPAQLQKSLFLLGREMPTNVGDFYHFSPYNYGPFSKQVYDDTEEAARIGFVDIGQVPGARYSEYTITWRGRDFAAELRDRADPRAVNYLERVVTWAKRQSFSELVRSIYRKYPEFRVNSVFQD
jgi:uncharacterized protein